MTSDEEYYGRLMARYDADPNAWHADAERHGWTLPRLSRWQRLPIVRHWWALRLLVRLAWRVVRVWNGTLPPGFEREVWTIYGIHEGLWHE